jgi:Metallo-peptidase family M12B Reprolysin-like
VPLISRKPLFAFILFAALACDGGPSGLSTGNLSITVAGLPTGSSAAITVTGPDGYSQSVAGTQILTQLVSGTYTVTASSVTVGSTVYSATPASQSVAVGSSTANASILYGSGAGNLALTINGLGTSGTAAVTVTGPGGYGQPVTATTTLTGLTPGTYDVTAGNVNASCGTLYTPGPATQSATIISGGTTSATVNYSPQSSGSLNLCIDGLYLTQSTQTYTGSVPLVQNRDGYLRVFVIANQANAAAPAVHLRLFNGSLPVWQTTILAPGPSVPTSVDEGSLSKSWNVAVSGTLIQPGLRIEAEVDPAPGIIDESSEADNVFPAAGPLATTVRAVPTLNITLVPIVQSGSGLQGNVSNPDAFLAAAKKMHPLDAVNVAVRAPVTTSTDLEADGTGWATVLGELNAIRTGTDHSSRYYYGVAKVAYTSGVAGIAYVSSGSATARAALGWDDLPSGATVAAHELGHNWARNHAPCGGPTGLDNQYPRADGSTGVYGLDVASAILKPPTSGDIMGYCDPKWISDYTYKAVLNYLSPSSPVVTSSVVSQAVQPCLLVWGHIRNGEMVLEPAFQVNTRPSLPQRAGQYSVSAGAEDGTTLFNLSFEPQEIADLPGDQKNFAFAVPISDAGARQLTTLRLSGRGRQTVRRAQPPAPSQVQPRTGIKPPSADVHRLSSGGMGVRWDARTHPMVMVRDAQTGEVLSLARGGSVQLPGFKREVDLVLSDGVRSSVRRVPVTP